MKNALLLLALFPILAITACGGGSSDSGGPDINVPDLPPVSGIGARVGSEFIAERCIDANVGIGGTTFVNSCPENVNIRKISGDEFGPVFLIAGTSTRIIVGVQVPLGACFAPKVPGGVASLTSYQCL